MQKINQTIIAKELGISQSYVSLLLSGKRKNQKLKQKILAHYKKKLKELSKSIKSENFR